MTREQQVLKAFEQSRILTTSQLQEITGLNNVWYVIAKLRKKGHIIYTVQRSIQCYYEYIGTAEQNRSKTKCE